MAKDVYAKIKGIMHMVALSAHKELTGVYNMSADWDKVKVKAKEVRKKYAVKNPPVNAFDIAGREGINIVYFTPTESTKDISALLSLNEKKVYLNLSESPSRQNFSLAHELAHYFLGHQPNEFGAYKRDSLYIGKKPEKEQEADFFAAELLMPSPLISRIKTKYQLADNDYAALAKLFGVSPTAMRHRLRSIQQYEEKA